MENFFFFSKIFYQYFGLALTTIIYKRHFLTNVRGIYVLGYSDLRQRVNSSNIILQYQNSFLRKGNL